MTVKHICALLAVALAVAGAVWAQSAPDQLVEGSFPNVPVAIVVDGGTPENETWGRPRALQSYDGSSVLLYAQGLPDLSLPRDDLRDQIWLFQNENTQGGWSTLYDAAAPIRILPSPSGSGFTSDTTKIFAHHWPYKWDNRYFMLAQISGLPGTRSSFRFLMLGKSLNGVSWTWRKFLRVRDGSSVDQIAWKDVSIGGQTYQYGFMSGTSDNGGFGMAAIRFRQSTGGCDWCFDITPASTALEVWRSPNWVTVPTCASIGDTTSGYDFCMYRNPTCASGIDDESPDASCAVADRIDPTYLVTGRHPSLHRLERHGNKWELWYHHIMKPDHGCGCTTPSNETGNNNSFAYRQIFPPTMLTQDPKTTISNIVRHLAPDQPAIRCMPGGTNNRESRLSGSNGLWTCFTRGRVTTRPMYSPVQQTGDTLSEPAWKPGIHPGTTR